MTACEHLLTHIVGKHLDDTSDNIDLTIKCDDCGEKGEISVNLDSAYEQRADVINWADGTY